MADREWPGENDEINRIVAGGNYGWPTVTGIARNSNFRDPILAYTPTIAPTGIISIPENSTVYPIDYVTICSSWTLTEA